MRVERGRWQLIIVSHHYCCVNDLEHSRIFFLFSNDLRSVLGCAAFDTLRLSTVVGSSSDPETDSSVSSATVKINYFISQYPYFYCI